MTPEELAKLKEQMNAAMDFAMSPSNPFSRVAERMKEGKGWSDAFATELYAHLDRVEARQWLREGPRTKQKRSIHTYSAAKTTKLVEELYAAGAKTVWVLSPGDSGVLTTSDVLLVALPEDTQHRLALARIHAREMAKVWGSEPEEDVQPPTGEHLLFQYT